ncbi:hypothetical protein BC939DRAFT_438863 [Gamsiella multidivaricata]|uniref:uncharacterized protein n=1 Tax=Gamsiella multidivaricata TaxID=101098 RepID=UPI00221F2A97|nr:uncharacterized protein BC939DRAFT_438863 [Gamsiella multidivaricata]KAI7830717.1 hypothetical protein BC939DRAFT_438863 [Gamsiella multidivaricata]
MKESKASITIAAPPYEVWEVLTDLRHYEEWNPLFVQAKGTVANGEALSIKMRLPMTLFCGAPFSKLLKAEPESHLEWIVKGFVNRTHYFQLTSDQGGTVTEFTQGERYEGWGTGFYSGFRSMGGARRGFVAMNSALKIEVMRRREAAANQNHNDKDDRDEEDEIAQLDISDGAAVVAAIALSATTAVSASAAVDADVEADVALKNDKEASRDINATYTSTEDPATKMEREARNPERIELDLGSGSISIDFDL